MIAETGHGLAGLSVLANSIISGGIEDGSIALELWMFSELTVTCDDTCAWVTSDNPVDAACTYPYGSSFPMPVPGLLATPAIIEHFEYDFGTGKLTGLVDKELLLAQLKPDLRELAGTLIELDTDTDGDGEPDRASAILTVELGE